MEACFALPLGRLPLARPISAVKALPKHQSEPLTGKKFGQIFLVPPQDSRPLHSLYTEILGFPLAGRGLVGAESKIRIQIGSEERIRW
jgi:hypothetical protein